MNIVVFVNFLFDNPQCKKTADKVFSSESRSENNFGLV